MDIPCIRCALRIYTRFNSILVTGSLKPTLARKAHSKFAEKRCITFPNCVQENSFLISTLEVWNWVDYSLTKGRGLERLKAKVLQHSSRALLLEWRFLILKLCTPEQECMVYIYIVLVMFDFSEAFLNPPSYGKSRSKCILANCGEEQSYALSSVLIEGPYLNQQ